MKVSEPGLTTAEGTCVTTNVTGTTAGLLTVFATEIVTVPVYVPAVSPLLDTDTVIVSGEVPLPTVAVSQASEVATESVETRVASESVKATVCGAGLAPLATAANNREPGEVIALRAVPPDSCALSERTRSETKGCRPGIVALAAPVIPPGKPPAVGKVVELALSAISVVID